MSRMLYRAYLSMVRLHGSPHAGVKILRLRMVIRGPDTVATPCQLGADVSRHLHARKAIDDRNELTLKITCKGSFGKNCQISDQVS